MVVLKFLARPPAAPPIEDPERIDRLYRRLRLATIVGLTVTYGFYYTCRLALSVVKKPLIDGGIYSAEDLGWIGAAFFWTYAAGKLINGVLSDRVSIRAFIPLALAISAAINIAFGAGVLVAVAVVLWAINGWVQGVGAPACVVSITRWFGIRERGTVYGVWSTAHSLGEGVTFGLTSALVAATAWQAAFIGPGVVCAGVAMVAYTVLRDRPESVGLPPVERWRGEIEPDEAPDDADWDPGKAQLSILRSPAIWIICLASASMYVSRYAINNWGILFLQERHGLGLAEAGALLGINTLAGIGGCAAYGWISDRFFNARRPPLTLIFGLLEILALIVILYGPTGNRALLIAALILYGFTLSGLLAVLGGLFAVDLVPRAAVGAAMGMVGVFSYVGAGIQEVVSGTLVGAGTTVVALPWAELRFYDFGAPAAFWVGASVVSMILAATLWRVRAA
jgi:OPA family sugar phosphate sensor protein UhpC-like MFS transporter